MGLENLDSKLRIVEDLRERKMRNINERICTAEWSIDSWLLFHFYNFCFLSNPTQQKCNEIASRKGAFLTSVLRSLWAVSTVGFIVMNSEFCNVRFVQQHATHRLLQGTALLEFWLTVLLWYTYSHMRRKWTFIVLLWRPRPRADGGLDVDCLDPVIAVLGVEINGRFLIERRATRPCSKCTR